MLGDALEGLVVLDSSSQVVRKNGWGMKSGPLVEFLAERGLVLSPEKTKITHIGDGFDFLGWNLRKYNGKLLIKPSKANIRAHLAKLREVIKTNRAIKQVNLIGLLNPISAAHQDQGCCQPA